MSMIGFTLKKEAIQEDYQVQSYKQINSSVVQYACAYVINKSRL